MRNKIKFLKNLFSQFHIQSTIFRGRDGNVVLVLGILDFLVNIFLLYFFFSAPDPFRQVVAPLGTCLVQKKKIEFFEQTFMWDIHMFKIGNLTSKECCKTYSNPADVINGKLIRFHLSAGFLLFPNKIELLGVAHRHYDQYSKNDEAQEIRHGHHYTHKLFTVQNKYPYQLKSVSKEFCIHSGLIQTFFFLFLLSIFFYPVNFSEYLFSNTTLHVMNHHFLP